MIDAAYNRTPQELVARYKFEPELNDLYVEGISDKILFINYIKHRHLDYEVYEINTVETDIFFENTQDITGHRINVGNKERIESLSDFFEENLGPRKQCIFCICDKDHDTFLGEKINNSYLRRTDFAALESYTFEERVLEKVLPALLRNKAPSGKQAITALHPVVKFLFLIRITRHVINRSWVLIDIDKAVSFDKAGNSSFSLDNYLDKLISKNAGASGKREDFVKQFQAFEADSTRFDYRLVMHGHDFGVVINLYLKKLGCESVTSEFIEKVLLLSIEAEDLDQYALFQEIAQCQYVG